MVTRMSLSLATAQAVSALVGVLFVSVLRKIKKSDQVPKTGCDDELRSLVREHDELIFKVSLRSGWGNSEKFRKFATFGCSFSTRASFSPGLVCTTCAVHPPNSPRAQRTNPKTCAFRAHTPTRAPPRFQARCSTRRVARARPPAGFRLFSFAFVRRERRPLTQPSDTPQPRAPCPATAPPRRTSNKERS